jgi:hypothetical protein
MQVSGFLIDKVFRTFFASRFYNKVSGTCVDNIYTVLSLSKLGGAGD